MILLIQLGLTRELLKISSFVKWLAESVIVLACRADIVALQAEVGKLQIFQKIQKNESKKIVAMFWLGPQCSSTKIPVVCCLVHCVEAKIFLLSQQVGRVNNDLCSNF